MKIIEKIQELKKKAKKRNFTQRYDLIINLRDIDLRKTENRINEFLPLPKGPGKENSITIFSDTIEDLEGVRIIKSSEIEELAKDKKKIKKLIKETDFFLADPPLMPVIGKHLGKFLAPRGMMPKPIVGDVKKIVEEMKRSVKISLVKQPVIQTVVGSENMSDEDVEENIRAVLSFLEKRLPKGKAHIKSVYLKLTMSPAVKLEVS